MSSYHKESLNCLVEGSLLEKWSSFCLCSMSLREGILRAASKKEFCCRRRRRFKIHRVMMMMIACLNMAGNLKCEYIFSTYKSFIHHCRDVCNAENLTVKTSKPLELWNRMAIQDEYNETGVKAWYWLIPVRLFSFCVDYQNIARSFQVLID